jgi:hypothetical protein
VRLASWIAAALLAGASALHAQERRAFDCSQAKDPKACEERVAKLKGAHQRALKACEGKPEAQSRACMRRELCAQTKDPKACESRMAQAAVVAKARNACEGKTGDERRDCMRRETCAQTKDAAQCEARIKAALAKREKVRAACKDKKGEDYTACIREQRSAN